MKREISVEENPPFRETPGERIGGGWHSGVRELGHLWVVKNVHPFWQRGNWKEKLIGDFYNLETFFKPYIPQTYFVEGINQGGRRDLFTLQRRVEGQVLQNYSYKEILDNQHALVELDDFTHKILEMYDQTGGIPDIHGNPVLSTRQYDIKFTDNILLEPSGKLWLVDIDRLGPLWSSDWFVGRWHVKRQIDSVLRFRQRLGFAENTKASAASVFPSVSTSHTPGVW